MSMGDFPRLPDEMIPRVEKLADKVKAGEVDLKDIMAQLMGPAMNKLMPTMMRIGGPQLATMLPRMMPAAMGMLPVMMGKQLFIKVEGVGYYILKIGMPPKLIDLVPTTFEEVKAARIPGIYIDLDLIPMFFQGMEGMISMMSADKIRIYGVEEIMSWGANIPNTGGMMDMMTPLLGIMTKEVLDSIQEPYEEIGEMVLSAFGV
ncbi:MAG: hypothetical protein JW738_10480 [Actinobacteria bacterium]|nr:hypothetical protein [Actinomycetota bacterium]